MKVIQIAKWQTDECCRYLLWYDISRCSFGAANFCYVMLLRSVCMTKLLSFNRLPLDT
uniref:Uncharacterized protein n=1 Tax=Rhizophora mucronata TaxID=61149 RepID=A0A2P2R040_RHIMU